MEHSDLQQSSFTHDIEPNNLESSSHRKTQNRSCTLCRRRKVRCDKVYPCSNCSRADVLCFYSEPYKRPRRHSKLTVNDILDRITRLERTVNTWALSNQPSTETCEPELRREAQEQDFSDSVDNVVFQNSDSTGANLLAGAGDSDSGLLLQQGDNGITYVNEFLFECVLKEEQQLRSVLEAQGADELKPCSDARSFTLSPLSIRDPLPKDNIGTAASHCPHYPSKWQALQLWHTFVNNVDPVLKILHIPSVQVIIYSALNNPISTAKDVEGLLFAIFFAAVTSLPAPDAAHLLGVQKSQALGAYRVGLEHALSMANFLESPSVTSLQAITIYLACLQVYDSGRAGWSLIGLAIRLAQSLGLHKDGNHFNLPPFESEMRRRLWWSLYVLEARSPENHGIVLDALDHLSDACLPLNANDNDLAPDMQTLPCPRVGWTEMSFTILKAEISQMFRKISEPALTSVSGQNIFEYHAYRLEESYLKCCDDNIPVQRVTALATRTIIAKMQFIMKRRSCCRGSGLRYTEELLNEACNILEISLSIYSDDLMKGFYWYAKTYTQYNVLTYVLGHLCALPQGPSINRAWKAVDESFQLVDSSDIPHEFGSKWTILRLLRGKALQLRQPARGTDFLPLDSTSNLPGDSLEDPTISRDAILEPWALDSCTDILDWNL
ncbi:fungal-specific transcription factor domain-containing protein [Aspergillus alliaceus]|uniref:Fungal-specific transcription factor domain-containing protein n=1 Tax=Petromyces alliaceus TaxID=209559 RepID=A0A5N7C4T8_PETAA|nr:fungal-specific transcription factor domain-containing protein [Aspergillus alliaceus]